MLATTLWDSVLFWDWLTKLWGYDHWAWGSAAEWVGGLLTGAAFWRAGKIYKNDRKREYRRHADSVSTWHEEYMLAGVRHVLIHLFNAGNTPVVDAFVRSAPDSRDLVDHAFKISKSAESRRFKDGSSLIMPEEHVVVHFLFTDRFSKSGLYVSFKDGRNTRWHRGVLSSEYLSRKVARANDSAIVAARGNPTSAFVEPVVVVAPDPVVDDPAVQWKDIFHVLRQKFGLS